MRWVGTSKTTIRAVATLAAAALLAACGSDAERNVPGPDFAAVTGAGRNIDFPAQVKRADYPNACRLLPNDSMQVLIGAPVTSGRTTAGCAWSGGEASLPTVALQFVEIGEDASSVYTERRTGASAARSIPELGSRARLYRVNDDKTTRIDVLKRNVFFRVEVRLTTTAPQDLERADQIGIRVAQLVAGQVS